MKQTVAWALLLLLVLMPNRRGGEAETKNILDPLIRSAAQRYDLDPLLLRAIIAVESEFKDSCVSPAGAEGLMQLMPQTAALLNVRNTFDPKENIFAGSCHFRHMLNIFHGDVTLALAGYNAGEFPVKRWHGIPPYAETHRYVRHVLALYGHYRTMMDAKESSTSERTT